jgi:hypothetical protein
MTRPGNDIRGMLRIIVRLKEEVTTVQRKLHEGLHNLWSQSIVHCIKTMKSIGMRLCKSYKMRKKFWPGNLGRLGVDRKVIDMGRKELKRGSVELSPAA